MTAAAVAPSVIRWHINKVETLPFHFGFHEKKPLSYEYATIHRKSITRLEQHFYLLRQEGEALIINKQAAEQKYEKEDKFHLKDELTAGGGQGAVEDQGAYEPDLIDQAAKEREAAHATMISSAKTFGAENATFDPVDEDPTVAAVDTHIMSQLTKDVDPPVMYDGEAFVPTKYDPSSPSAAAFDKSDSSESEPAFPPAKDDILNLPAKDEVIDLSQAELIVSSSGVPVVIPVAEPVEPTQIEAVKQADHPEEVEREEEEDAERAAAQAALASGSFASIEQTLFASALKLNDAPEVHTGEVQMPIAEPVGTVTTTLHAPHPSIDDSSFGQSLDSQTLASETESSATPTLSLEELRQQHETEAAEAKAETERLESPEISAEERETAEIALMTRTKRLAALHERIIRHQTLEAQGPNITSIKKSPTLPATTASSKIMEIQQLHLAAQAESGVTHTAVEKSTASGPSSRTRELAQLHEQKIKEEAEAKKEQDELFAGKKTVGATTPTGGKSFRKNNRKR